MWSYNNIILCLFVIFLFACFLAIMCAPDIIATNERNNKIKEHNKLMELHYKNYYLWVEFKDNLPDDFYEYFLAMAFVVFANDSYIHEYCKLCEKYKDECYTLSMQKIILMEDWYKKDFSQIFNRILELHDSVDYRFRVKYDEQGHYPPSLYIYYEEIIVWFVAYIKYHHGNLRKFPDTGAGLTYKERYELLSSTDLGDFRPNFKKYAHLYE